MDPREIANRYYDAWINRNGDMSEVLEIRDGRIVRGELFYDAEELRKAMARGMPR
jgi:hypothetical protein